MTRDKAEEFPGGKSEADITEFLSRSLLCFLELFENFLVIWGLKTSSLHVLLEHRTNKSEVKASPFPDRPQTLEEQFNNMHELPQIHWLSYIRGQDSNDIKVEQAITGI